MKKLFHLCVEGTVNKTYQALKDLEYKTDKHTKIMDRYDERFYKKNPDYRISHEDLWIENVINTYRSYFVDVLTNKIERSVAEADLMGNLNRYLPAEKKGTDMQMTEESVKNIFNEKGFGFLSGRVEPHYGPFIWKTIDKRMYHVELPDTTEEVQVCFLDDFLMLSWLHFATFGEVYAGGWTEKDALYCIVPNYRDILNEALFLVSFLKHEAQHYCDYRQFPKLKGPDLEYRAKLVEIIYYPDYEFLEKLLIQAVNKPNPHNYSAYIILKRFSAYFFNKDTEKNR